MQPFSPERRSGANRADGDGDDARRIHLDQERRERRGGRLVRDLAGQVERGAVARTVEREGARRPGWRRLYRALLVGADRREGHWIPARVWPRDEERSVHSLWMAQHRSSCPP